MNIKKLLSIFNLRDIEIEVYKILLENGQLGATEVAKKASISRTSVYDLLDKLIEVGLVSETQKMGQKFFTIQPPEKLKLLIEEKEAEINQAKKLTDDLADYFYKNKKSVKPKLQLFDGKQELQQMMKDLLLYRDITVYAFWPVEVITKLLTPEFMTEFHKKRTERNISLKVIWPAKQLSKIKKHAFLKDKTQKRQAKIAPANIDFSLGYTIYGNTVRFISSSRENFGFLVESRELADTMKAQFEFIWQKSRKI